MIENLNESKIWTTPGHHHMSICTYIMCIDMHISYHSIYIYISWKTQKKYNIWITYPTFFMQVYIYIYMYKYKYIYIYDYIPSFPISHGGSPTRPHRRMTITPRSGGMVGSTGDSAWDAKKTGGKWWFYQQKGGLKVGYRLRPLKR